MSHIRNKPAITLSVRISPALRDQLENLSEVTRRTKSFLAVEAIESYLAVHSWQAKAIGKSLAKADSKKAKFVSHSKVVDWLNSWDTKDEKEPPK